MLMLFNVNKELIDEIERKDIISLDDKFINKGLWTSSVTYLYEKHNKDAFYYGYKYQDKFYLYYISNVENDSGKVTLEGIHLFFYEMQGRVVREVRSRNSTLASILGRLFKDSDWEFISDVQGNRTTSFYYLSYLDSFWKILEVWNCEFSIELNLNQNKIGSKKIYLKNNISKNYGKIYESNSNLVSVVYEENHLNVFTSFIGRGAAEEKDDGVYGRKIRFTDEEFNIAKGDPFNKAIGIDYVEIENATKQFGYRECVIDFDEIEDRRELALQTYYYALENSRPKLTIKTKVYENEDVEVGEIISVINSKFNIRYKTKVQEVSRNLLIDVKDIKIGDSQGTSTVERLKDLSQKQEENKEMVLSKLNQALNQVTNYYFNEDGYNYELKIGNLYNLPAGYYSFNKPIDENPTKVTYLGAGKVLIADEKGSDGNWKWKTAIDGTGISGSEILANSVTANKLASDVGQGLDLSSNEYIQSIVSNNSDISEEVYKKISELNNLLEDKISESTINSLLEEINNQLNVNSTKINQNENKLEIEFNSIKAEIDNNRADLNNLTSTITSGQDEEGNSYTEWGSTSDAKVRVGANGIDIISNDQEVMSFRDGEAYAKALYVTETIGFGNHTAQKYGTKYTVFSWNGGK